MGFDYDQIAASYDDHRRGGGPYLERLRSLATEAKAARVIELGAGTGANTGAFLRAYPCELFGIELSKGMLAQAARKRLPVGWIQASATHLPLADGCADFVFACYVIHHIRDINALMRECARTLRAGMAAFVTCSHDFIARHPANAYFPSFAAIDQARFQPLEAIEDAMRAAGFRDVRAESVVAAPVAIDHAYVERIAGKFISTYALVPPEEFEAGLQRMRAEVSAKGRLDVDMVWECAIVWGRTGP